MIANRRRFLFGAGATLLTAPAIVRVASLMPVSVAYGGPVGGAMTTAELIALQERWLLAVTAILEETINPVLFERSPIGPALLRPPVQKWFTLSVDKHALA